MNKFIIFNEATGNYCGLNGVGTRNMMDVWKFPSKEKAQEMIDEYHLEMCIILRIYE